MTEQKPRIHFLGIVCKGANRSTFSSMKFLINSLLVFLFHVVIFNGFGSSVSAQMEEPEGKLVAIQVLQRHGSRVPDVIYQSTENFWRNIGGPGMFSSQGQREMQSFGTWLRDYYINDVGFLPEDWVQKEMYLRASQARYGRVTMSSKSSMSTFYPDSPIPIYAVEPEEDTLMFPMQTCPSYIAHYPRATAELNAFFQTTYPELLANIIANTGWQGWAPSELIYNITDNLHSERTHNHAMDPFFLENYFLLSALQDIMLERLFGVTDTDEDKERGPLAAELVREVANNFQSVIDGSDTKVFWYTNHGEVLGSLWNGLGLGYLRFEMGGAAILELRETDDGTYNVNLNFAFLLDDQITFDWTEHPLACPDIEMECPFRDFYDHIMALNPKSSDAQKTPEQIKIEALKPRPAYGHRKPRPDTYKTFKYELSKSQKLDAKLRKEKGLDGTGCCFVSSQFYAAGCDAYDDPNTVNNNVCFQYRKFCPGVACGVGRVVDMRNFMCLPVAESKMEL